MRRVIALGFFDGVHIGHGALLSRTAALAKELDATPAALTFDSHPERLITGHAVPLLLTITERAELMRRLYGIQEIILAHFDMEFMQMRWKDFVDRRLSEEYGAVHVVAGHDFHFGYRGEGNPSLLKEYAGTRGMGCDIVGRVELDGITVSATYIRKLVAQGEMQTAARFLGHRHQISGLVEHGRKLGSSLGFPTVNISIAPEVQHPAYGVYATSVEVGGIVYAAATNVGVRPTVDNHERVTVESTLFDFDGDLYGKPICVLFDKFLRPERHFPSLSELQRQISLDIQEAKLFHSAENDHIT